MSRHGLWSRLSRDAYLAGRAAGDVDAVQRGRLGRRLFRRAYHRSITRLLRRGRIW
jgi:hypothetical protein